MPRRGPYKQYEVDATIAVPKFTLHDIRKWRLVEVNIDDHVDINDVIDQDFQDNSLQINDQVYLDDYDLQVRH